MFIEIILLVAAVAQTGDAHPSIAACTPGVFETRQRGYDGEYLVGSMSASPPAVPKSGRRSDVRYAIWRFKTAVSGSSEPSTWPHCSSEWKFNSVPENLKA